MGTYSGGGRGRAAPAGPPVQTGPEARYGRLRRRITSKQAPTWRSGSNVAASSSAPRCTCSRYSGGPGDPRPGLRRFAATWQSRHPPGPTQRGRRKSWRSSPASGRHPCAQPPDFRAAVPRLSRDVTPSLQLTCVLPRPDGTPLVSGRAACCGGRQWRSSTQACRYPSSRRRCGTPPRGRTGRTSLS